MFTAYIMAFVASFHFEWHGQRFITFAPQKQLLLTHVWKQQSLFRLNCSRSSRIGKGQITFCWKKVVVAFHLAHSGQKFKSYTNAFLRTWNSKFIPFLLLGKDKCTWEKKEERMKTKYVKQLLLSSFKTSYMIGKVQECRKVFWGKIRTKCAFFCYKENMQNKDTNTQ